MPFSVDDMIKDLVDEITEELVHRKIKEEIINLDDTIKVNVKEFLTQNKNFFEKIILDCLDSNDVYNDIALLATFGDDIDNTKKEVAVLKKQMMELHGHVKELQNEKEDNNNPISKNRAHKPWKKEEDYQLKKELRYAIHKIAYTHQRSPLAILNRIDKILIKFNNLNEPYLDVGTH